jgi:hypothetical protein
VLRHKGQLSLASLVYFTLSKLIPSPETVLEHAIIDLESPIGDKTQGSADSSDGQAKGVEGKDTLYQPSSEIL